MGWKLPKQYDSPEDREDAMSPVTPKSTTFTPGPWEVNGRAIEQAKEKDYSVVCYLEDEHTEEWHANARLIALAPEMVEELRNTAEWIVLQRGAPEQRPLKEMTEWDRIAYRIRALLARLEG